MNSDQSKIEKAILHEVSYDIHSMLVEIFDNHEDEIKQKDEEIESLSNEIDELKRRIEELERTNLTQS